MFIRLLARGFKNILKGINNTHTRSSMSKEKLDEIRDTAIHLVSMIAEFQARLEESDSDDGLDTDVASKSGRSVLSVAFPGTAPGPVPVSVTDASSLPPRSTRTTGKPGKHRQPKKQRSAAGNGGSDKDGDRDSDSDRDRDNVSESGNGKAGAEDGKFEKRSRAVVAPTTRRPGAANDSSSVVSSARSRVSVSYEPEDDGPGVEQDWTDTASRSSRARTGGRFHRHPH